MGATFSSKNDAIDEVRNERPRHERVSYALMIIIDMCKEVAFSLPLGDRRIPPDPQGRAKTLNELVKKLEKRVEEQRKNYFNLVKMKQEGNRIEIIRQEGDYKKAESYSIISEFFASLLLMEGNIRGFLENIPDADFEYMLTQLKSLHESALAFVHGMDLDREGIISARLVAQTDRIFVFYNTIINNQENDGLYLKRF